MTWIQIITIVVSAALTLITGTFLRYISRAVKDVHTAFLTLRDAQRDSLRYQIVQAHDYFSEKGCIGKYSLDCIEAMYESYHKLGGNGFIKNIMLETRELPIK